MTMDKKKVIQNTIRYVKKTLEESEGGHDWFHINRVYKNALLIAKNEKVDLFVVQIGALLHDIADSKFYDGNESIGPEKARAFLKSQEVDEEIITHIENIILFISYKSSFDSSKHFSSPELNIIQDADRLDAMGAIGVARCFNYGGFKNRKLYDPEITPNLKMNKEEYKKSNAPSINHFYEKLLLLKDKMNTKTGKKLAKKRHLFMVKFLKNFFDEWNGLM